MQIFCVIPHPLRDHFAIISRSLYPINVLSVSYVYLFLGRGHAFDLFRNHSVTTLMFTVPPQKKNPHNRFVFRLCGLLHSLKQTLLFFII